MESPEFPWSEIQENILKEWRDKSKCYYLLHNRAFKKYSCLNLWFVIPVVILSTIAASGSFAQSYFGSYSDFVSLGLGGVNILAGLISTIGSFTYVAQKSEANRISSLSWDKFSRKIEVELSKPKSDRMRCKEFMKMCEEEYNRLREMAPDIPDDVVKWFKLKISEGDFDDEIGGGTRCFFEYCCFPCGCDICNIMKSSDKDKTDDPTNPWNKIEKPEILGTIKPIEVAKTRDPEIPPPLNLSITRSSPRRGDNEYEMYRINPNEFDV